MMKIESICREAAALRERRFNNRFEAKQSVERLPELSGTTAETSPDARSGKIHKSGSLVKVNEIGQVRQTLIQSVAATSD